jgi:hypothetical protein
MILYHIRKVEVDGPMRGEAMLLDFVAEVTADLVDRQAAWLLQSLDTDAALRVFCRSLEGPG